MKTYSKHLAQYSPEDYEQRMVKVLAQMMQRPIAYHPALARLAGSVTAGIMLSQAYYWQQRTSGKKPGWFYKSAQEWEAETCLTVEEQTTARKRLRSIIAVVNREEVPVWLESREGIPARLFYRVDLEALACALAVLPDPEVEDPESRFGESLNQETGNAQIKRRGIPESRDGESLNHSITESTSKSTSETTNSVGVQTEKPKALQPLKYGAKSLTPEEEAQQREWIIALQSVTDLGGGIMRERDLDALIEACQEYTVSAVIDALRTAQNTGARSPIGYALGILRNRNPKPLPPPRLPATAEEYIQQQASLCGAEKEAAIHFFSEKWTKEWEELFEAAKKQPLPDADKWIIVDHTKGRNA